MDHSKNLAIIQSKYDINRSRGISWWVDENRPSLTPKLLDSSLDLEAGIDKMMSHLMKLLIENESTQEELRKANRSEVKLNICWKILSIKRMEEQRKREIWEIERKEREDRMQQELSLLISDLNSINRNMMVPQTMLLIVTYFYNYNKYFNIYLYGSN